MRYEDALCVCCGGKWRVRVTLPALRRSRRTKYVTVWKLQVICGRCNSGDCGGSYIIGKGIIPCFLGRAD